MPHSHILQKILGNSISQLFYETKAHNIIVVQETKINRITYLKTTIIDKQNKEETFYLENKEIEFKKKINEITIKAIKLDFIQNDSKLIFVFDDKLTQEFELGVIIIEVPKLLYKIARYKLNENIENKEILEKVLNICEEIRLEGREGKKIGTLFIIGDENELKEYTQQLILNPFQGYPQELTNIISNELTETIKEFAQIDGCFIINKKGNIISAGTYINIDTKEVKKYYGWGTKHLTSSAITQKTNSIAILLSESGNKIKIFKEGKLIYKY